MDQAGRLTSHSPNLPAFVSLFAFSPRTTIRNAETKLSLFRCLSPLALLAACGCGGGVKPPNWPDPVPTSGTVTFADQPLADATVTFSPEGATPGPGGNGVTDSSGKFEIKTDWGNGNWKSGA